MKIVISHGSGGIGSAELICKEFLEANGLDVELNDYFSKNNIKMVYWSDKEHQNKEDVTFKQLCDLDVNEETIHIGFSLGGFVGLVNNKKFVKNFLFYPGLIGYTQEMLECDYSNTTVYFGSEDPGKEKFYNFMSMCDKPPSLNIMVSGAHHAFMTKNMDRTIDMVRYNNLSRILSNEEFSELKINHEFMSKKYGYHTKKRILTSHDIHRNHLLNLLLADIKNTL